MWLLYISCAWVAGIFVGSQVSLPLIVIPLGLVPFLFILLFPDRRKSLIVMGLCFFAFIGGGIYFPTSLPQIDEQHVGFYDDTGIVEIRGMVKEDPDVRDRYSLLRISTSEITIEGEKKEVSGDILIRVSRYPEYHYGDVLNVTGELETPPTFEDFDYRSYLEHQGIYSISYYPRIEVLDEGKGFKPLQWLYSFRESLSDSLAGALPEPQGSLAQGILLGIRSNVPYSVTQAFSRTGTAHILAISGLHISIIIGILLSFLILVFGKQRYIYIWLTFIAVWIYALLTGMHPPVIRAAIMGSLFLLAEYLGRQRSAITALAFAAAVMVGIQPQILWSVSFQLSFMAMLGLILFYPYFQSWGRKGIARLFEYRDRVIAIGNIVIDGFAVSLAAIIVVWPLVAYYFNIVSLVGVPATFLSLPALPAIIVTSALVAFVGLFAVFACQILGWVVWLFLSYLLLVVQGFDALPFSSFQVSSIPVWLVWTYYIMLATVVALLNHRNQLSNIFSRLAFEAKGSG
jgi:competence protein ComEC